MKYQLIIQGDFGGRITGYVLEGPSVHIVRDGEFHDEAACRRDAHQELAARGIHIPIDDIGQGDDPTLT